MSDDSTTPDFSNLPTHDLANDESISDARREACLIDYDDMQLHHIDKIFTSAYVYDKKTGKPIAKKPRSLHEMVFLLSKAFQTLCDEIDSLGEAYENLSDKLKELEAKLEN